MTDVREHLAAEFKAGKLTAEHFLERVRALPPPWQSAKWKERKATVIGDCCATCGANGAETILVIQHRWHPAPFPVLCERVKPALRLRYAAKHPLVEPTLPAFKPDEVPFGAEERECCPKCQSPAIIFLKNDSVWKCNGKKGKGSYGRPVQCGHRFEAPLRRLWSRYSHAEQIQQAHYKHHAPLREAVFEWERAFVQSYRREIMHAATLLSIEEHERYVALLPEDTVTLCKPCAFKEDARAGKIAGRF